MGWLELIALMKRLLPLLSRVAPMLETYLGARGAVRGDTEAIDRLSGDLQAQLASGTQNHLALSDALEAQNSRLLHLSDELQHLRAAQAEGVGRFDRMERQVASAGRLLRTVSVLTVVLLLACVGLLVAILLRH